jgi:hypothetical protein
MKHAHQVYKTNAKANAADIRDVRKYKDQSDSLDDLFKFSQRQTRNKLPGNGKMYSMLCSKHGKKEENKK